METVEANQGRRLPERYAGPKDRITRRVTWGNGSRNSQKWHLNTIPFNPNVVKVPSLVSCLMLASFFLFCFFAATRLIYYFTIILSECFNLIRVGGPGAYPRNARHEQEYTLDWMPVCCRVPFMPSFSPRGQFRIASPPTGMFWEVIRNPLRHRESLQSFAQTVT